MAAKIRKGDKVVVLTGRDKGRSGEVIRCVRPRAARSCAASTWSSATRSRRASQEGGIISKEAPIHLSNLALADPKDGKPTRVGFKILDDGRRCASPSAREKRSMADKEDEKAPKAEQAPAGDKAPNPKAERAAQGRRPMLPRRPRRRRVPREPEPKGPPRLRTQFDEVDAQEADRAVRLQEPDAGAARSTRSCSTWASARRRATPRRWRRPRPISRMIAGQKPVITHGPQGDRDLQAAREPADRRQGHAAQDAACTSSSTGWSPSRCRACATSAASIRRASTAAATTRSASRSTSFSPRSTTTRRSRSSGMDIIVCTTAKTDDEARALLEAFNFPFRQ